MDNKILRLVVSQCQQGHENEIEQWYIQEHFPLLMKFNGLKEAALYRITGNPNEPQSILAAYVFDNEKSLSEYKSSQILSTAIKETEEKWKKDEFVVKYRLEMELVGKIAQS